MTERKSIFITGAAAGIGKATALLFARRNWFVGLFDVDQPSLADLYARIGADHACFRVTDVTNEEDVRAAAALFGERTGGRMNVLFNNAGVLRMGTFAGLPLAEHKATVNVNLVGLIHCTHICLDMLKHTPGAHIVNMSSASAIYGTPELSSYSATKFAVRALTESLNIELEPHGIVVCDIIPGYVRTPMILNQEYKAGSLDRLGITLEPEDVAEEVWRAAHGARVHRYMGLRLRLFELLSVCQPVAKRAMKRMVGVSGG